VLAIEADLPLILIARGLGVLERLPGVAVFTAWPPVSTAAGTRARTWPALALGLTSPALVALALGLLLRLPQLSPRKPLQLGVGVLFPDAVKGRQQVLALDGAERRRQAAGDDRPIHETWRH
jgi:hypothetical protein